MASTDNVSYQMADSGTSEWIKDIFVGALGSGVNYSTLIAINIVTVLAYLSLVFLFFLVQNDPQLWPHVVVLLVLTAGPSALLTVHGRSCDACMHIGCARN